jgi:hypothetical protein
VFENLACDDKLFHQGQLIGFSRMADHPVVSDEVGSALVKVLSLLFNQSVLICMYEENVKAKQMFPVPDWIK